MFARSSEAGRRQLATFLQQLPSSSGRQDRPNPFLLLAAKGRLPRGGYVSQSVANPSPRETLLEQATREHQSWLAGYNQKVQEMYARKLQKDGVIGREQGALNDWMSDRIEGLERVKRCYNSQVDAIDRHVQSHRYLFCGSADPDASRRAEDALSRSKELKRLAKDTATGHSSYDAQGNWLYDAEGQSYRNEFVDRYKRQARAAMQEYERYHRKVELAEAEREIEIQEYRSTLSTLKIERDRYEAMYRAHEAETTAKKDQWNKKIHALTSERDSLERSDQSAIDQMASQQAKLYLDRVSARITQVDKHDVALEDCERVLSMSVGKCEHAHAHCYMGDIYRIKKQMRMASVHYGRSLVAMPNLAIAFVGRAYLHLDNEDFQDARTDIASAIEITPHSEYARTCSQTIEGTIEKHVDRLLVRARMLRAFRQFDGAIESYSQAIKWFPDRGKLYDLRGQVHQDVASYQAAFEDYQQAGSTVRINSMADQLYQRACRHRSINQISIAFELANHIMRWFPNHGPYVVLFASLHEASGALDLAYQYYRIGNDQGSVMRVSQAIVSKELPNLQANVAGNYSVLEAIIDMWLSLKSKDRHRDDVLEQKKIFLNLRASVCRDYYINHLGHFTLGAGVSSYLKNINEASRLVYQHLLVKGVDFNLEKLNAAIQISHRPYQDGSKTWLVQEKGRHGLFDRVNARRGQWVKDLCECANQAKMGGYR